MCVTYSAGNSSTSVSTSDRQHARERVRERGPENTTNTPRAGVKLTSIL